MQYLQKLFSYESIYAIFQKVTLMSNQLDNMKEFDINQTVYQQELIRENKALKLRIQELEDKIET